MKLMPYDLTKVSNSNGYKHTKNQKILEEFVESGLDCVKVEDWTQKTARGCASSFNTSIGVYKMTGIKAISRKGEVFLIKTSALK